MPGQASEIIEMELNKDGVYEEKRIVRSKSKKKELPPLATGQLAQPVEEFMQGFEMGASVIERVSKALRKIAR